MHTLQPSLGDLLLSFRRKIIDELKKKGHKDELTFSQIEVIHFIGLDGKKTMKEISGHLKITPPSATVMIGELEKKGIVKRVSDKGDRRIVYIELKEKTKKIHAEMKKRKEVILEKMLSKVSEKDRKELERIITIIVKD